MESESVSIGHGSKRANRPPRRKTPNVEGEPASPMKRHLGRLAVSSPDFIHGGAIPREFTADGDGHFPALSWGPVPEGTRSWVVLSHDPDAPLTRGVVHLVCYNIPAGTTSLTQAGIQAATCGPNVHGELGWIPPSPPPGHGEHSYYFHVYATDLDPDLDPDLEYGALLDLIDPHILEQARIVGVYGRS